MLQDFFNLLGLKIGHLAAGFAGGIVRAFLVGTSPAAAVASVVAGSLTAAYLTNPIAHGFFKFWGVQQDMQGEHAVAFIVGLTAMLLCEGALRYARNWSKNPTIPGAPK